MAHSYTTTSLFSTYKLLPAVLAILVIAGVVGLCYWGLPSNAASNLAQPFIGRERAQSTSIAGRSPLIREALGGDETDALRLLGDGADPNDCDSSGWTPLIAASYRGDAKLVVALVSHGAKIDARTVDGKSALTYAIQASNDGVAAKLIALGANPNISDNGLASPLMWAAMQGDLPTVEDLIRARANVNSQDARGYTALAVAIIGDSTSVAKALLENGANTEISSGPEAMPPLELALDRHETDIARDIILAGAPVSETDADGFDPLMMAVQNDEPDMFYLLLHQGANARARLPDGTSILCFACMNPSDESDMVWNMVVKYGAGVNDCAFDQTTPLMYAASAGHLDVVRVLLSHGANPNVISDRGMTALYWADGEGRASDIGALMRKYGAHE